MHSFRSKPQAHIQANRKPSAVHATIAPSRPQQATAKKAPSVNARVQYVQPAPKGEELFTYVYEKPENVDRISNLEHVNTEVPFTDLRTIEDQSGEFTLERNGFQLACPFRHRLGQRRRRKHVVHASTFSTPVKASSALYAHILLFEHCHLYNIDVPSLFTRDS